MRLQALRALLVLVALLTVSALLGIGPASSGIRAGPAQFRYAGVVENGRGAPAHYIARGDGFGFYFFDALSQGRRSESYRLCIGRAGKPPVRCWSRTAKYGVGKVLFSATLPSDVPLGLLTARWLLDGRTVATWQFLYVNGE